MNFNLMNDTQVMSLQDTDWERDFGKWKAKVNQLCEQHFGLSAEDLPDAAWADYYHDDMTPVDAIDTAVIDSWDDIPEIQTLWYGETSCNI